MKVKYAGNYRGNHVSYRGVVFTKGKHTEVEPEWYEQHQTAKLKVIKARKTSDNSTSTN
jgi:hypothetical protein